jgi:hypothetical protein
MIIDELCVSQLQQCSGLTIQTNEDDAIGQPTTPSDRRINVKDNCRSYLWRTLVVVGALGNGTPVAAAAAAPAALAPARGSATTLLVLGITGLIILILAILIRVTHKYIAPHYRRQIVTTRSIDQVLAIVDQIFPAHDIVGRPWVRKRSPADPQALELWAYPLPYWAGCLIMLATGIIWGFIAWIMLGRREQVTIRVATTTEGLSVQINALGNAATAKAQALAARLGGAQPVV